MNKNIKMDVLFIKLEISNLGETFIISNSINNLIKSDEDICNEFMCLMINKINPVLLHNKLDIKLYIVDLKNMHYDDYNYKLRDKLQEKIEDNVLKYVNIFNS